jgi:hypothetical protein
MATAFNFMFAAQIPLKNVTVLTRKGAASSGGATFYHAFFDEAPDSFSGIGNTTAAALGNLFESYARKTNSATIRYIDEDNYKPTSIR